MNRNHPALALVVVAAFAASTWSAIAQATAPSPTSGPVALWSHSLQSRTPQGGVVFHCPYCRDVVHVTFDRLGDHEYVEINFDLLILRAWDGSVPINEKGNGRPSSLGPDFFRLAVTGGPTLLYTTFSNSPDERFRRESLSQNYPSPVA